MLSEVEFQGIMRHLLALNLPFPPDFKDPLVVSTWYNLLKNLSVDDMRAAYRAITSRKWDRFPQVCQIVDMAHGGIFSEDHLKALTAKAWQQVMAIMSNTYEPKALDEITARALKEILPSGKIYEQDGWEDENLHWKRKEFEAAFKLSFELQRAGKFPPDCDLPHLAGARGAVEVYRVTRYADYLPGIKSSSVFQYLPALKNEPQPPRRPGLQKMNIMERFKSLIKESKE